MPEDMNGTYRLQLHKDFTLKDATAILPYLKALGVSDIYLSPVFESVPGSTHGYDVLDFTRISAERGGDAGFDQLNGAAEKIGLRLLLDIVPNHMGIGGENPFWIDVLAKGPGSRFWHLFDLRPDADGKIHLPVLGAPFDELLKEEKVALKSHARYGRGLDIAGVFFPLNEESEGDDIADLLHSQHYCPVPWTEAFEKLSYRRFFDITGLIGIRVEDDAVYKITHDFLFSLLEKYPAIRGVRVDHVDGLADPGAYLNRLKKDCAFIWIEKILSGDEHLPRDWPVQGTTGYEFIRKMNDLFIDPDGYQQIVDYWSASIEPRWEIFEDCVLDSKEEALEKLFPSELNRLVDLSGGDPGQARLFWEELTKDIRVYRTYAGREALSDADKEIIRAAVEAASARIGGPFEAAADIYLPRLLDPKTEQDRQVVREWQQLSGPAMAKGLEDTAHYRFTPFAAMNEVGCEVARPSGSAAHYLDWAGDIATHYPRTLLATSTHDTKRSEDVRHRLYALADRPQDWLEFFARAQEAAAPLRQDFAIRPATEYFLFQNIVGAWPLDGDIDQGFIDRLTAYALKSAKEARTETSWLAPDADYETHLGDYVQALLQSNTFVSLAKGYASSLSAAGVLNSLSVLTLKILGPATPDLYQGNECWDFSLVDPDNRRHVDYDLRQKKLEEAGPLSLDDLVSSWRDPALKLWMTRRLLSIRRDHRDGAVRMSPLQLAGPDRDRLIAYRLDCDRNSLIIACARQAGKIFTSPPDKLSFALDAEMSLEEVRTFENLLTGKTVTHSALNIGVLFTESPVVVLKETASRNI